MADADGGAELPVLDRELLTGEAADTHTHTSAGHSSHTESETERNCLSDGCGCTVERDAVSELLAMEMPERSDGSERTSITEARSESTRVRRDFNPDPRIADYEDGEAALEWMIGAYS